MKSAKEGRASSFVNAGRTFINTVFVLTAIRLCYLTVHQEGMLAVMDKDEKTLMATLARVSKTKSGYFSEQEIGRKHDCKDIEVREVLLGLQELDLATEIKKHLWKATPDGKMIEHFLNVKKLEERNPGLRFPGC